MTRTRSYLNGVLKAEDFPAREISERLAETGAVVWFDLCNPTPQDLAGISEELGLHPLAVEDAVHQHQRPKLDRYDSHLFITAYAAVIAKEDEAAVGGTLSIHEVAAFVTPNALVTVRKTDGFPIERVVAQWDESSDLAEYGVGFLLWGLLDVVVDSHFEAVQFLDTEIEALEDQLFEDSTKDADMQRRTFDVRKSMVTFRRVVLPMREVVNSLLRRDLRVIDAAMMPYYQDVYDHVLRATEWTESLRDLVTTILETSLTVRSNHLNVIMKHITSWAAIIAVPTAITGFYGQNVPYPGFGAVSGFWVSLLIMIAASATLYVVFRRKDWL